VAVRPDDIVISTPPKSGTTWMQGIVYSLLWPRGDGPPFDGITPWIDMRLFPIDEVATAVAAQTHRRFLKTHTPADCLAIDDQVSYLVVYRDGRDALVSWGNHRRKMRPELIEAFNASAAEDALDPMDPHLDVDDVDALLDEWLIECSSVRHLASWWPLRDQPNVCFVHYGDLLADLDGEMRRVAAFLELDVPDDAWPAVVDRCRIDEMRTAAAASGRLELAFEGGADSFFNQGTNGRWVGALTDAQLARYLEHVADGLPADAAEWLEHGSLHLGVVPGG
jgi:aryl sulfotransferase